MILLPFVVSAYDLAIENNEGVTIYYNFINNNTELEVTYRWTGEPYNYDYSGEIIIPSVITFEGKNYSVTRIGDCAFYDTSYLSSINIPNSVTTIGIGAFSGTGLTSITIPENVIDIAEYSIYGERLGSIIVDKNNTKYDSRSDCNAVIETETNSLIVGCMNTIIPENVTNIGNGAFYGCYGLTSISIPNSVTTIGEGSFFACKNLVSISIPESVTDIGSYAFKNCSSLPSITIPNRVTSIGKEAFRDCSSLTIAILGSKVTSLESGTFYNCYSLTSVTIPHGVTSIGEAAFYACSSLLNITIPNGVKDISKKAFKNCFNLKSVIIGDNVKRIGNEAFSSCSLTSVTIPNSVETIEFFAFSCCSNLISIIFQNNVTSIEYCAFWNCPKLMDIYCFAANVPGADVDAFKDSHIEKATLHVPLNSVELYKANSPWRGFGNIVPITEDDITPVNSISSDKQPNSTSVYYDLNGRPAQHPAKGIYIVNP